MTRPPVLRYGVPIGVTVGMWKGLRKYLAKRLPYSVFEEPSQFEQWTDEYLVPEIGIPEVVKEIIPEEVKTSHVGVWMQDIYNKFWDMDPRLSILILALLVLSPLLTRTSEEKIESHKETLTEERLADPPKISALEQDEEVDVVVVEEEDVEEEEEEEEEEDEEEEEEEDEEEEEEVVEIKPSVVAVKDINISPVVIKDEIANVPTLAHDDFKTENETRQTPSASTSSLESHGSGINDSSPHLPLQVSPAKTSNSNAQINNFQAYSQPFTY
ncbi:hypothetical protein RNJ44_02248 [Nakaseomyces bracarensis]|uniref:Uncharacterized protein n=1 Tax=Nakaseomyces bracarensis TaxID=273131 RepID=A0ABR4NMY2_9SACH